MYNYFLSYRILISSERAMTKREKYLTEQDIHELMNRSESQLSETSSISNHFAYSDSFNKDIYEIIDEEELIEN